MSSEPLSVTSPHPQLDQEMKGWYVETNSQWPGQAMAIKVKEVLHQRQSKFQRILVFDSETWGRVMVLDGAIQLTERDEMSYQEMLAHMPMFLHPEPKNVLVIGGGDGGVMREALKHKSVETATLVDIDGDVVEVAKEYFPTMASSFKDPRLTTIIGDGIEYCRREDLTATYDVVIIDSSDPEGPAEGLFNKAFLADVHRLLKPGGVFCQQGESLWLDMDLIRMMKFENAAKFSHVQYASMQIPTYPCGQLGALIGVKAGGAHTTVDVPVREVPDDMELKYYTSQLHTASFALPAFARRELSKPLETEKPRDALTLKKL